MNQTEESVYFLLNYCILALTGQWLSPPVGQQTVYYFTQILLTLTRVD